MFMKPQGVSAEEISSSIAIYIDKVGQINTVNSKWNLVLYYDLTVYYEELAKVMARIKGECSKLNMFNETCGMVMSVMDRRYEQLVQNIDLFIHKQHQKRAPFEFIGSLYNVLFGMMDAADRKLMEDNIRNI